LPNVKEELYVDVWVKSVIFIRYFFKGLGRVRISLGGFDRVIGLGIKDNAALILQVSG
jgi:hypothetical protein